MTSYQGRGAPQWLVSLFFLVFLYIWATILVIRMVALAARMVSRYHPCLLYTSDAADE